MVKALWIETLRAQAEQEKAAFASKRRALWEIAMRNRTVKLTAAAVVCLAALAVGVETLRPNQPNKTYAFSAEIQANMALDLDPKAAVPLRQAQPGDFDVTWDAENGGTLKIVAKASLRILGCRLYNPDWDDAVSWAQSNLEKLRSSTATAVTPTAKTPFAAVLTSEGNLAVIEIGGHDETHAWLYWRVMKATVPGYSPAQILTLHGVDPNSATPQPCAVNLESGQIVTIPSPVLRLPAEGLMDWLEQNHVDAIAKLSAEGDGLVGVGLVFGTWMSAGWAGTDPVALREEMTRANAVPREPLLFRVGRYQPVFPFKTRGGTMGMLQLLAVDRSRQTVQFRYRLLQDQAGDGKADNDPESQQLAESMDRLMRFGRSVLYYANDHKDQLPLTFAEMKKYVDNEQDYQWIVANVEYRGAGVTMSAPPSFVLAYDRTLLNKGKGTHVVFLDSHGEFLEPNSLQKYGIAPPK
jgi:hypothetical protein